MIPDSCFCLFSLTDLLNVSFFSFDETCSVGREAKLLYYLRLLRSHKKWEDVLHETLSL
jgi:hypothetical protein